MPNECDCCHCRAQRKSNPPEDDYLRRKREKEEDAKWRAEEERRLWRSTEERVAEQEAYREWRNPRR